MNNNKKFESLVDFLRVTKRNTSDNEVCELNREERRKFKKNKVFVSNKY